MTRGLPSANFHRRFHLYGPPSETHGFAVDGAPATLLFSRRGGVERRQKRSLKASRSGIETEGWAERDDGKSP
eukprot:22233-Pelagococcus_subviridis.AAC.1